MTTLWGEIKEFIPAITAFAGVLVGSFINRRSQKVLFKLQTHRENLQSKKQDLRDKFLIYGNVLKADGEEPIVTFIGGPQNDFDIDRFNQSVRPILYEKFYLLDQDIAKELKDLDHKISQCNYYQEKNQRDNDYLIEHYSNLMLLVEKKIEDHRKSMNL